MTVWNKDVLHLIFQEFEDGQGMLNFREISRRCHQVFHQNINIVSKPRTWEYFARTYMENKNGQRHGISCGWYSDGNRRHLSNFLHSLEHGYQYGWTINGQTNYIENYYYGKLHGVQSYFNWQGCECKEYYHYGTQIEK